MKILKPALLIVMSIFFIASCDIFKPKDDYERKDVDKLVEHLIKQTKNESI